MPGENGACANTTNKNIVPDEPLMPNDRTHAPSRGAPRNRTTEFHGFKRCRHNATRCWDKVLFAQERARAGGGGARKIPRSAKIQPKNGDP